MISWEYDAPAKLPGRGTAPQLYDSSSGHLVDTAPQSGEATLYVCGITPYDAAHLGHAYTYLAFDTLQRVWMDAGLNVHYAQNITDIDDPLLERAEQTHEDWQALAHRQIELFTQDMASLRLLPPKNFVAVTESIDSIARAVHALAERGLVYPLSSEDVDGQDLYFDIIAANTLTEWSLGDVCGLELDDMLRLSRERGGDPNRPGKRNPLDPLLWRAERAGEPAWNSPVGRGRPGWHIECSEIATSALGPEITVQGGGVDLLFPHHEFSSAHATGLTGRPLAQVFAHAGMVEYQGQKMSKSRGNLVFVHQLVSVGIDPMAIRLALLKHHYRSSWEWFDDFAPKAMRQLALWRERLSIRDQLPTEYRTDSGEILLAGVRRMLADDMNTPAALELIESAIIEGTAPPTLIRAIGDSLIGLKL